MSKPIKSQKTDTGRRYRGRRYALAALTGVVLLAAGWGHRQLASGIEAALGEWTKPKAPLNTLPLALDGWVGEEIALDPRVLNVGYFDDDWVNRAYINRADGTRVGVFVGYMGRPRIQMGHRPDVCYAAHGWDQTAQEQRLVVSVAGREIPCLLYEFRQPGSAGAPMYVLATYMINGAYVEDPDQLKGWGWGQRSPGLLGERSPYLTRIQLSLPMRVSRGATVAELEDLMAQAAPAVVGVMPYWGN